MMSREFVAFQKIPRISNQPMVITEKVDGTNAQINILDNGDILFGSRNRYLTIEDDNFGFCEWGNDNKEELSKLEVGRHFGEWYGQGIQRGYGLNEKRLSLFNVHRWGEHNPQTPRCCDVVPLLYTGKFSLDIIDEVMNKLKEEGSSINNFNNPEGIIIFLPKINMLFKKTFDNDKGKWNIS